MSFNLTIKSLEYWLRKPEFNIPKIGLTRAEVEDEQYKLMEANNRILGRSFHHTFGMWFQKWGRIPTPQEFIAMQMKDIKKNYQNQAWRRNHKVTFNLTPIVEKGLKQRLLRSYISFINELHTELQIQEIYPKVEISRNDELDFSGIDIQATDKKRNVVHNIHITKNSVYAIDFLFKKEGKFLEFRGYNNKLWAVPCWKKSTHPIYKERDFSGHVFLLYDPKSSDSTKVINGYPLFKEEYIKNKLEANYVRKKGA
ncbi:hypothetical protein P5F55_13710 [Clostridium perfringens]|nr:hypothetical protein [Clostridium perfringens]MDM0495359.1 hypothetical protein [Clostridium perfringens]MDM0781073.1 hypothetical protein [Clostridium perfringens]